MSGAPQQRPSLFAEEALTPGNVALTLALSCAGGGLFALAGAPLAWMLGAMAATTAATFSGMRLAVYPWMRTIMIAVLGVMLGSAFSPELLGRIAEWLPAVALMIVFVAASTALAIVFFRQVAGFDPVTAYFASTPGGLTEMALMGAENGADMRTITLVHATRILLVVSIIPFYFRVIQEVNVPVLPSRMGYLADLPLSEAGFIILCTVLGILVAQKLRVPAAALIGPMVISAALHLAGIAAASPPVELVAAAQVIVGGAIGCRFAGLTFAEARRTILYGAAAALIMIALAALVGGLLAPLFGRTEEALILALAPGGLAEMSLIALSIGVDTAFISTMHILRIFIIVLAAPAVFFLTRRLL